MKLTTLTAVILSVTSTQVFADKVYWLGTDGEFTRDRNGHCVRTILWTPEAAIPGCEGGEAKTTASAPAPAPAPVAVAAAPAPVAEVEIASTKEAAAVVVATSVEPKYTDLSLSSGATFELGGSVLSAEGKATVIELMSKFEGEDVKSVVITGHTDGSGDASFNQRLSEQRAEAVKTELVKNGANPDKITTKGYGESNPIADNGTREGRAKNRRVEIQVDSKTRQL